MYVQINICIYVCIYTSISIYLYIYLYIYTYIYIYIYTYMYMCLLTHLTKIVDMVSNNHQFGCHIIQIWYLITSQIHNFGLMEKAWML
jgi:hypothetical protein